MPDNVDFIQEQQAELLERQINAARVKHCGASALVCEECDAPIPAGRSYVDQSKNEYHINLTGGTAPGTQLDRQLQDALEKYERDKRARARASMMHDG